MFTSPCVVCARAGVRHVFVRYYASDDQGAADAKKHAITSPNATRDGIRRHVVVFVHGGGWLYVTDIGDQQGALQLPDARWPAPAAYQHPPPRPQLLCTLGAQQADGAPLVRKKTSRERTAQQAPEIIRI